MRVRIYYEDVDVGGVVYHTHYINFCERARSELFFSQNRLPIFDGYAFVVKSLQANYIKSAKFGDMIEIKTHLKGQTRASITLTQSIYREEEKLFEMDIVLVCTKGDKLTRIPDELTLQIPN